MRWKGSSGFTLIELLIVVAIIAVIAAISLPNLLASKQNANQVAALATMRNLVSCQAQVGVAAKIDADKDGKGEYATFLEMSGAVGVRKGFTAGPPSTSDFSAKGEVMNPTHLSSTFSVVTPTGFATKSGYVFTILLPDGGSPAGFAHEAGPAASASLSAPVGVDLAETAWCAYAQPITFGGTGVPRFFVNQKGDILRSSNEVARGQGNSSAIAGNSAFLGAGITSPAAVGTKGIDGDVWTVAQ